MVLPLYFLARSSIFVDTPRPSPPVSFLKKTNKEVIHMLNGEEEKKSSKFENKYNYMNSLIIMGII